VTMPSEFQIQRAVCIWLDGQLDKGRPGALRPDVVYWHTPNGGARSPIEGKRFKEMGVKAGIHDLLFLQLGRLFGLELKAIGGSLSEAQRTMHRRLLATGMAASATVDSLAAARGQLFAWGLTLTAG